MLLWQHFKARLKLCVGTGGVDNEHIESEQTQHRNKCEEYVRQNPAYVQAHFIALCAYDFVIFHASLPPFLLLFSVIALYQRTVNHKAQRACDNKQNNGNCAAHTEVLTG